MSMYECVYVRAFLFTCLRAYSHCHVVLSLSRTNNSNSLLGKEDLLGTDNLKLKSLLKVANKTVIK